MRRRDVAPPVFDDESPWGTYRPQGRDAWLLRRCRALAADSGVGERLLKLLRRPIKYGATTPLDVEVWGLRLRLLPRGNVSEAKMLFAPQAADPDELRLLDEHLAPGATFVDVGANAGLYSLRALARHRDGVRVIAVEPDPEMRRRLAFNITTNALHSIEVCALALSDHEGRATLHVKPAQRGESSLEAGATPAAGGTLAIEVPVTTLLTLLRERGVGRVDVLKIDIEGHEPPVLRHFFAHAPDALLPAIAVTEFKPQTADEIRGLFESRGYRLRQRTPMNWVFERPAAQERR
jgi:FkbM family methyltransferase